MSYVINIFKIERINKLEEDQLLDMLSRNLAYAQSSLDKLKNISLMVEEDRLQIKDDVITLLLLLTSIQEGALKKIPISIRDQIKQLQLSAIAINLSF